MTAPLLAVIGEALMDVVDQGGHDAYLARVGGSPLNVAGGLARLEQPTALLARFSTDAFGRILRSYAASVGADLSLAVDTGSPSTLAVVQLDDAGVARYDFHVEATADWGWTDAELDYLPASVRLVHFGSLASWMAPGAGVVNRRIAQLRAGGDVLISYDPNVRPGLLTNPGRDRETIEASVAHAHLVKASVEDLDWLYSGDPIEAVAARWLDLGPQIVIVTRGGEGSTAFVHGLDPLSQAVLDVEVVDTIGAGDAYMSGLLDGLVRAGATSPEGLAKLLTDPDATGRLLADAALVAGLVCSRAGASPPSLAEVLTRRVG